MLRSMGGVAVRFLACSAFVGLSGCATVGYIHQDAFSLSELQVVPQPLARELVSSFEHADFADGPQDPWADAPWSSEPSPAQIVKTGPDVRPIAGRPHYRTSDGEVTLAQGPVTQGSFGAVDIRVDPDDYERMSKPQVEALHSAERAAAGASLVGAIGSALLAIHEQAHVDRLASDVTLRRRIVAESGAVGDAAPPGTRLHLYYQLVATKPGALGQRSTYYICLAQLQEVQPDGTVRIVDGEGFGYDTVGWYKQRQAPVPVPEGYLDIQEAFKRIDFFQAPDAHPLEAFADPRWEVVYRSCRVALDRLSARVTSRAERGTR